MFRAKAVFVAALFACALLVTVASVPASTPSQSAVTVPSTSGQTVRDAPPWSGTVAPGTNPTSDCSPPSPSPADQHTVSVTVPSGAYDSLDASFKFSITWTPSSGDPSTSDLILTVIGPDGDPVGSSDSGSTTETVSGTNLPAGDYTMLACGFANAAPQPYDGKLEITTTARSSEDSLPSAPAQGLEFSAAVASDNQRDQSEPLLQIDKAGNVYDCGPTGFSNVSDYAQVSTDHGDQFHLLGTPPRGQQGAGGGGDCGIAFGTQKNSRGNYQYAYTGLGPLTGFVTSTSANNGHSLVTGGPFGNGNTDEGGGADRQWMTFVDDHTVLLSYNQQVPRNVVVQRSTDGGLTYGPDAAIAARSPRFPGPMRYIEPSRKFPNGVVFFAFDRAGDDGDHINLSISQDRGITWTDCVAAVTPGTTTLFSTADSDQAGNIYVVYGENLRFHTYMVSLTANKVKGCNQSVADDSRLPTVDPGFATPVQVDRDAVRSTVFPWVTAGGAPGRIAVTFAGTETDGNPNSGNFKASWDIYANESLNALAPDATFSQVKVTTHPFHYDSICLNGLACDLAVPPGDRSMADFLSIDRNRADGRLYVTWDRANKKPDEASGHVASPMVATQIGGPRLKGTALTVKRPVVRQSSSDPTGDALSSYSWLNPADPLTVNEPAGDLKSVSIGPESRRGFTVTMKLADLSTGSLLTTAARTGSQSLLWVFRFTNGYQDAAASARWNAAQGFTYGFNDYTVGNTPCASGPPASEKCVLYPGNVPIQGSVDQANGMIKLSVPRSLLRALSGPTGPGQRPSEVPATAGSRFYDATVFSLGNTVSADQSLQSFLYPLDNTPSMDFLLPPAH